MDSVTVITANFNGSKYLGRAIESVVQQSHHNIEYIIVDDGSKDVSKTIIERWANQDKRITPIYLNENVGVASARNIGIEKSSGKYIAFLDADDVWDSNKIEKQVACFESHPKAGVIVTGTIVIDENDGKISLKKNSKKIKQGSVNLYDYVAGKFPMSINAMTRRECLEKAGYFNPNYIIGEDYELWMRITRDYEYYFIDEPLHFYRIHQSNATKNKLLNRESKIKILEEMVDNDNSISGKLAKDFNVIMQRKYNSLGKAYYLDKQFDKALNCFNSTLNLRGSSAQILKAKLWILLLKTKIK